MVENNKWFDITINNPGKLHLIIVMIIILKLIEMNTNRVLGELNLFSK